MPKHVKITKYGENGDLWTKTIENAGLESLEINVKQSWLWWEFWFYTRTMNVWLNGKMGYSEQIYGPSETNMNLTVSGRVSLVAMVTYMLRDLLVGMEGTICYMVAAINETTPTQEIWTHTNDNSEYALQ